MQDVFGRPVAALKLGDYEAESIKVLTTAWIGYAGEALDVQSSRTGAITYFPVASHFVDDRLLTTIVSKSSDNILTCYHEDFNRPHKPAKRKLEQMVKYVEHLGNQRRGNMLRHFSVERFTPPSDARPTVQAELDKVLAIPEKLAAVV